MLFSEGDQLPPLSGVLKGQDIAGKIVRMTLQRPDDVIVKDATLTNAICGGFEFAWADDDLVAGSGQVALIQLIDGTTAQTLARLLLDVCEVPA